MPGRPSDHLLKTLASVPVSSRILDADFRGGERLRAIALLGFDVYGTDEDGKRVRTLREEHEHLDGAERRIVSARAAALGFPDDFFDWVVADRGHASSESLEAALDTLSELRRVMKPGGWLYLVLPVAETASATTDAECLLGFYRLVAEARFELAERGEVEVRNGERVVRAIFRRVESDTPI